MVVIGAGGLGHIAVQLLRAMTTAQVIVVDRSTEALDLAASLGAHVVIQAGEDSVEAVREAAAGRGAEVVLDFVGDGGTPADAIAMLARRGTYVAVGYGGRLDVGLIDIVANEIVIRGWLIGTHTELAELVGLADRSLITVKTQIYPLDAIRDAMSDLRQGQSRAVRSSSPDRQNGGAGDVATPPQASGPVQRQGCGSSRSGCGSFPGISRRSGSGRAVASGKPAGPRSGAASSMMPLTFNLARHSNVRVAASVLPMERAISQPR